MTELIRLKLLYITSLASFLLALAILPLSIEWSMVFVLFIVTMWSKIPGFIHFTLNRVAIDDIAVFIIALNMGGLTATVFIFSTMLIGKAFAPNQWTPYVFSASVSMSIGAIAVPFFMSITGSLVTSYFAYMVFGYFVYYLMIFLFWRWELATEATVLPFVLLFDVGMSGGIIGLFGETLSKMMTSGLSNGFVLMIFSGAVLGFIFLSKNAEKIGNFISRKPKDKEIEEKYGYSEYD